jgi:hypothetical protein
MAATASELLDACNDAILALIGGAQSYSIAGRSVTKANLAELREMRTELQKEVQDASNGGSMCTLGQIDHPT